MVLNYLALAILILVVGLVVYGVIAVYGIPYEIAKARQHPHQEAIGAATWVSLLTLGTLWPLLWVWALIYRSDRGWGFSAGTNGKVDGIAELERRIAALETHRGTES